MFKDEEDIIVPILKHMLAEGIEHFYIADNNSTDGTRDILEDFAREYKGTFIIVDDLEIGYYQAQKMNRFIDAAVELGAEIILPFDADELIFSRNKIYTLAEAIQNMPHPITVATVWDMVPQPTDINTGNPVKDIVYREAVVKGLPSIAYRYEPGSSIVMGNHDVNRSGDRDDQTIGIRQYQYRSFEQYKRKLRNGKKAYDATDLPDCFGSHWRVGGTLSDEALHAKWQEFINQPGLIYDPSPYSGDKLSKPL